jgi:hypothetical protein
VKVALRLLLLLGFGAIGLYFLREVPRSVGLVYVIDDSPSVRKVDVEIRKGASPARRSEFRFPAGAPREVRHDVKLADGDYQVVVRVWRLGGSPQSLVLPVTVTESGPIVLAIRHPPARSD